MQAYDVVIIGAGHNGLTCAAYLGMAGLKVKVLERRSIVGGAAVTEEFHPGFRNSVAAYAVSLLNPKVIADLRLFDRGLKIVERRAQNFLPTLDGRYLLAAEGRTESNIAKFSRSDAGRFAAFARELDASADLLRELVLQAPPNLTRGAKLGSLRELVKAGRLGNRVRRLSTENLRTLLELLTKSAADYLDGWFEGELVKAWLGFDAIVGNYASPYTAGSAYVLLHHAFGEVNGKKRVWGHAIGGMGAITQAMARAAAAHGVEIETEAPVREVLIEKGRAAGVVLEDGRVVRGKAVAANVNPKLLYTAMIPQTALDPDFLRRMRAWRCGSGTFRINLALSELPSFTALPGRDCADHHTAGIILGPSLDYMDRAYCDARTSGWSREPIIELVIPSTLDDTLAPPGAHVASLFCQHVAPQLPDGRSWSTHREKVADLMIETVDRYAPGFKASVVARQALSPFDLEQVFGLTGGDIFHGAMTLDQLFWARPALGYAEYRGAVKGLYHCGSGAHPGGGVTGAPGHNAARAIIADQRWRVWWQSVVARKQAPQPIGRGR
ncbi:MAG: NAD(P)/FAD-dependent oxidoreductase [Alphaproteobacteria bacterium]|nr:MAG: NAD(P)/FAD-dependent oxidoreductase [Alphaproteobacteria bacterium]